MVLGAAARGLKGRLLAVVEGRRPSRFGRGKQDEGACGPCDCCCSEDCECDDDCEADSFGRELDDLEGSLRADDLDDSIPAVKRPRLGARADVDAVAMVSGTPSSGCISLNDATSGAPLVTDLNHVCWMHVCPERG